MRLVGLSGGYAIRSSIEGALLLDHTTVGFSRAVGVCLTGAAGQGQVCPS